MISTALPFLLSMIACQVVESPFSQSYSAEGIDLLRMELDKGDITYSGSDSGSFEIDGRNWGRAGSEEKAAEHQEGNSWDSDISDATLSIWTQSENRRAGIDFTVGGPVSMETLFYTASGHVSLKDLAGSHYLEADGATLDYVHGSTTIYAGNGGVRGDLVPSSGDSIYISSEGDVDITLPFGLDYDFQVWGDAEQELYVEDMGFYDVMQAGPYFAGLTGTGKTRVTIDAEGDIRISTVCWDDCNPAW